MPRLRVLALAMLPLLLLAASAQAHPHVWVDYELVARFEHGRIAALEQEWSFDEDFSASVLADVVKHHGGGPAGPRGGSPFSPEEVSRLKQTAFSNLKNYDYFTHVWAGAKRAALGKEVTDFQARLEGDKLVYRFTLVLPEPVDPRAVPVKIGIWDDSYYVDVGPAKGHHPRLEGDGAEGCKASIAEDKDHPIYFGSVFPPSVRISC